MALTVEREFQLAAAIRAMESCGEAELRVMLVRSWQLLLAERTTSEELIRASTGLDVRIGGPLVPPSFLMAGPAIP